MEEGQNSVQEEVTPQDQDSTIVEQESQVESQFEQHEKVQAEDPQERNWRELRRKEQEAQQKLKVQDEFIRNLIEAQKAHPRQTEQPREEVDPFAEIPDDEFTSKGQTRQMIQRDARAIAREEFNRLEQERDRARFAERLKARYSDFDEIVNPETIAILEQQEPELATTIADLKDPYKMGVQTYKFIKAMNLYQAEPENRHAREVKKKIDKNEKAVQSPQAYNKRPMAQAFSMANMSKEEKTRLYEEMMGYASQSPGY